MSETLSDNQIIFEIVMPEDSTKNLRTIFFCDNDFTLKYKNYMGKTYNFQIPELVDLIKKEHSNFSAEDFRQSVHRTDGPALIMQHKDKETNFQWVTVYEEWLLNGTHISDEEVEKLKHSLEFKSDFENSIKE